MPVALSSAKMGDSFIFRRIYSEIATRMMEMRKGMRQP
jgi:hypothetical protein